MLRKALATFLGVFFSRMVVLSSRCFPQLCCRCLSVETGWFSSLCTGRVAFSLPAAARQTPRLPEREQRCGSRAGAGGARCHAWPAGGSVGTRSCRAAGQRRAAARPRLTFVRLNSRSFITDHKSGMNIFTCVLLSTYNI